MQEHIPDTEVHSLVREMQRNMSKVQASETSKKYHARQQPGPFNFPKLPWWAWLIVAAHLLYRITKVHGHWGMKRMGWARGAFKWLNLN